MVLNHNFAIDKFCVRASYGSLVVPVCVAVAARMFLNTPASWFRAVALILQIDKSIL